MLCLKTGSAPKVRVPKTGASYIPSGDLMPARTDENGNIVKPSLTYEDYYAGIEKKYFVAEHETVEDVNRKAGSLVMIEAS